MMMCATVCQLDGEDLGWQYVLELEGQLVRVGLEVPPHSKLVHIVADSV